MSEREKETDLLTDAKAALPGPGMTIEEIAQKLWTAVTLAGSDAQMLRVIKEHLEQAVAQATATLRSTAEPTTEAEACRILDAYALKGWKSVANEVDWLRNRSVAAAEQRHAAELAQVRAEAEAQAKWHAEELASARRLNEMQDARESQRIAEAVAAAYEEAARIAKAWDNDAAAAILHHIRQCAAKPADSRIDAGGLEPGGTKDCVFGDFSGNCRAWGNGFRCPIHDPEPVSPVHSRDCFWGIKS